MFSYVALEDGIPVSGLALQRTRDSDSGQVGRFSQGMEYEGEQVLQPAIPHGRMQTETRPTGRCKGLQSVQIPKIAVIPAFYTHSLQIFHAPRCVNALPRGRTPWNSPMDYQNFISDIRYPLANASDRHTRQAV